MSYANLGALVTDMSDGLRPPERLTVSEAAAKYRHVNNPGSYVGPWKNETVPYMVEPANLMADRETNAVIFVGPAQTGKALALDTLLPTPDGWTEMGEVQVGDLLLDERGEPTSVVFATEVQHDRKCFAVLFDRGVEPIIADEDHQWVVNEVSGTIRTTELREGYTIDSFERRFTVSAVHPFDSVPVRCIQVDSPNRLYLAGQSRVPTHNTDALIVNPILYSVICDPMDMLVYQTSQTMARDFSRRRVDRLHRHSPDVGSRLLPSRNNDNTHDKHYRSGMILTLSWPTINELSGRPVGRVILTDYDRMPMDVDGEGSPFDLARKRTTTFGSAACTVVESSPGYTVQDPAWIRHSAHEAPPCEGILALYNRGDRRRWYWPCIHCGEWFEPSFGLLHYVDSADFMESAESAQMMCPHCKALIAPDHKYELNLQGRWVRDGQRLTRDGKLDGLPARSDIASFWMKGPAATFAKWSDLVLRYRMAEQEFERTGSQEALKSTVNTDQGEPYYPRGTERERLPAEMKEQATTEAEGAVPDGVRFLIATVDVQKNMWVCQVFGVSPGEPFKLTVIDRFDIRKSKRKDDDGDTLWVKPSAFLEDWDLLEEEVKQKEYPTADGRGFLSPVFVACDSGGRAGVTARAYDYYRKLRGEGKHRDFYLIKGRDQAGAPRTAVSYPDASKKDKKSAARGDVPVLLLQVNLIKDELNNMLERSNHDGSAFEFPEWLSDNWFTEMCAERRTDKGWENPRSSRNEAWDLAVYAIGICRHKKVDRIDWDAPPSWAAEGTTNPYYRALGETQAVASDSESRYTMSQLAKKLA